MELSVQLTLDEEFLPEDMILLKTDDCKNAQREDYLRYDPEEHFTDLWFWVHRDTGKPLRFELDSFKSKTKRAIQELRECPLPWLISLELLGVDAKPMADVLEAIWEKYKDIPLLWTYSDWKFSK